jgi:DNA-binding transcriptional regulator LsrR (DeoR family)
LTANAKLKGIEMAIDYNAELYHWKSKQNEYKEMAREAELEFLRVLYYANKNGNSYQTLANWLGISKSYVQQLVNQAKEQLDVKTAS